MEGSDKKIKSDIDLKSIYEQINQIKNDKNTIKEHFPLLKKIQTLLNNILKPYDENIELEKLSNYIKKQWRDCQTLRDKIDNEGKDYFYNSYATVPVSWEVYSDFCESCSCYCGRCDDDDN